MGRRPEQQWERRRARSPRARPAKPGARVQWQAGTDLFLLNASGLYQQVIGLVKRHPLLGQDQQGHAGQLPPGPATSLPGPATSKREREITPSSHRLSTLPAWVWCCPQAGGPLRSGGLAAAADLPNGQAGLVPGGHQALSAATALGCLCSAQNQAHQMRGCCGARHPMEKTGTQESQPSRGQGRQRGPGRGGGLPGAWDGATGPAWSSQLSQRPACRRE